jgi:hypothetical protein
MQWRPPGAHQRCHDLSTVALLTSLSHWRSLTRAEVVCMPRDRLLALGISADLRLALLVHK